MSPNPPRTLTALVLATVAALAACGPEEAFEETSDFVEQAIAQSGGNEATFYTMGGAGGLSAAQTHSWGRDWFRIVPLRFSNFPQSSLLFYNRSLGTAKLFHVTNGQLGSPVKTYANWRTTWDHIIPLRAVAGGKQSLFFYDRSAKLGRTYVIEPDGTLVSAGDTTLADYDLAVAGDFVGDGREDVALYDRTRGRVTYCDFDYNTGVPSCAQTALTEKRWDVMLAGNFTTASKHELLVWDRDAHELQLLLPTSPTSLRSLWTRTDFDFAENKILAVGQLGGNGYTDLLMYDPRNGTAASGQTAVHLNDGTGNLGTTPTLATARQTWSMIIPGQFSSSALTGLLFYDYTQVIDVLVVRGADTDGTNSTTVSLSRMNAWVDQLNRTFATAGVRFQRQYADQQLDYTHFNGIHCNSSGILKDELSAWAGGYNGPPAPDFPGPPTLLPDNPTRRPRLLIYLPAGLGNGVCSSVRAQFVLASRNTEPHMLAHEVGHFFSLGHVFHGGVHGVLKDEYVLDSSTPDEPATADMVNAAVAPDAVAGLDSVGLGCAGPGEVCTYDTPPDPGPYFWPLAYANYADMYCDPSVEIPVDTVGFEVVTINPDRFNLMTYRVRDGVSPFDLYDPCQRTTMTFDQARGVREVLQLDSSGKKRLLQP